MPITFQDVVVTFCTVTGWRKGLLVQKSDARKIYHQKIGDELWSAIQITTAAGIYLRCWICTATGKLRRRGLAKAGRRDDGSVRGKSLRAVLRISNVHEV